MEKDDVESLIVLMPNQNRRLKLLTRRLFLRVNQNGIYKIGLATGRPPIETATTGSQQEQKQWKTT